MACKTLTHQRGSVGIGAIIAMMVLALLGTAYVGLAMTELKISTNYRDAAAAQYLAEAGALSARIKLKYDIDGIRSLTNTDQAYQVPPTRVYKNTAEPTAGYYEVIVEPFQNDSNMREIVSVGTVNTAQRIVKVRLELSSGIPIELPVEIQEMFTYSLFSGSRLTVENEALITGNIRSNDKLVIGKAKINGTAYYPQDHTGISIDPGATLYFSPVVVTNHLPYPDLTVFRNACQTKATHIVTGDYTVGTNQSFNKAIYFINGNLTVTNNITLTGKAIFYVTGDITFTTCTAKGNILMISEKSILLGSNTKLDHFLLYAVENINVGPGSVIGGALAAQGEITTQGRVGITFSKSFLGRVFEWTNF